MKRVYLSLLIALLGFTDMSAQQDPHYTQYMYNMNVINPAYAGSKENLAFGLLWRNYSRSNRKHLYRRGRRKLHRRSHKRNRLY
ncbi:type IX secretion system membrane protein PorP/SprF [Flavobacterium arcticum]|uniref:Type IX secretion system membrane protein PorP/SprF n=1 Tax=Flavobacterium arcticum TaxID=1784713 RepID=A0A345HAH0_9FLAO|nr:type IX secretion system membrane protein PorP/SprF [Flavobacterium arcticum]